jgi:CheY-like chemotaxis protein
MAEDAPPLVVAPKTAHPGLILVVDDDATMRRTTAAVLRDSGHSVLELASGEQALALANHYRGRIALLITDISMPGIDGQTLARILRAHAPATPVVFITALASAELELCERSSSRSRSRCSPPSAARSPRSARTPRAGAARQFLLQNGAAWRPPSPSGVDASWLPTYATSVSPPAERRGADSARRHALVKAPHDAPPPGIVARHLDAHAIAEHDANVAAAQPAAQRREHRVRPDIDAE